MTNIKKAKLSIIYLAIVFYFVIPSSFSKSKPHFQGPDGGSYHFLGVLGSNKEKKSLYVEWFVNQLGDVELVIRASQGGRLIPTPLELKPDLTFWVSVLGNEGLSAKKVALKRIKNDSDKTTKINSYSGLLPEKFHGQKIFVVIPEIEVGPRKLRSAGPVFPILSKPEIEKQEK